MHMKNDWRQKLHLEPESGWLNDPNGLSYFQGKYHVYFQYAPESALGTGPKCWGHWQSKDLLHWEFTGTVLSPDLPEDQNGVYSGCGLVRGDTLYLFYTGNVKEPGDYDYITAGRGANVILVTTADGHHMSPKQVLLRNADYPSDCSCHVRDPKVWEEDGRYHMALGARKLDDTGCVLFYTSEDLLHWEFACEKSVPDMGYMWECPDVLLLNGKHYLSISPQGLTHTEFTHQNVYSSGYFVTETEFEEWDYGFDFYAPQTFAAPDGRRLLIGWMGIGDIPYTNPTTALGWQHCLTIPREITVGADGRLRQQPVRELETLRKGRQEVPRDAVIQTTLPFELIAPVEGSCAIRLGDGLQLQYADGVFSLFFLDEQVGGGRNRRNVRLTQCTQIRLIADTASLEIYLNDGEKVMSSRFYPTDSELRITMERLCGTLYALDGLEVRNLG